MPAPLSRQSVSHQDLDKLSSAFSIPLGSRSYAKQYAQLYDYRLAFLRRRVLARAANKWSHGPSHVERILDIRQGDICYIVGNIYCSMPLKPDVLEDLTREVSRPPHSHSRLDRSPSPSPSPSPSNPQQWLAPQPARESYVDYARDELFIEDQSGRVRLVGDAIQGGSPLRDMLVTGTVAAVLGTETRNGDFDVVDAVFAGLPDVDDSKTKAETSVEEDSYIVLMSGLSLGGSDGVETETAMQFLTEWITGELGDTPDRKRAASIVATVVAGNALAPPSRSEADSNRPVSCAVFAFPLSPRLAWSSDTGKQKRLGQEAPVFSPAPTLALDQFLTDIASAMPVHILPGERDPASIAMPQQPIHHALLPRASKFSSLHRETNPAWIGLQGRKMLGTSGQNIDDIAKYSPAHSSRLDMAIRTLEWSHVAPTAPDTLWCYPFKSTDPFVIKDRPDLLFVGNQPAFATAAYEQTRVVLVPKFAETRQVVLVNLRNMEAELVQVGAEV